MYNKKIKLYNIIFPIWLLWIIPKTWIFVFPINFIIDLTVLTLAMKFVKAKDILNNTNSSVFKVWFCGFLADIIGTMGMLTIFIGADNDWFYQNIFLPVSLNPFKNIFALIWVSAFVLISGIWIYLFNYNYCLGKTNLTDEQKSKVSLILAIFTAPYLFYLPSNLIN